MSRKSLRHDTHWFQTADQFMGSAPFGDIPPLCERRDDSRDLPDVDLVDLAEMMLADLNLHKGASALLPARVAMLTVDLTGAIRAG